MNKRKLRYGMLITCFWVISRQYAYTFRDLKPEISSVQYMECSLARAAPDWSINQLFFCDFWQSIILNDNRINKTAVHSMILE
jgi:hypothetical protein